MTTWAYLTEAEDDRVRSTVYLRRRRTRISINIHILARTTVIAIETEIDDQEAEVQSGNGNETATTAMPVIEIGTCTVTGTGRGIGTGKETIATIESILMPTVTVTVTETGIVIGATAYKKRTAGRETMADDCRRWQTAILWLFSNQVHWTGRSWGIRRPRLEAFALLAIRSPDPCNG